MTDVLASQERLLRIFETAFRCEDVAETLVSFDAERNAAEVRATLEAKRFRVAGVREDGKVSGYVRFEDLEKRATCGDSRRDFVEGDVLDGEEPLVEVIRRLDGRSHLFVSVLGAVNGIVTWSDLQKPPVRMWLFGLLTLIEIAFTRLLDTVFADDAWTELVSETRLEKAREMYRERVRRGALAESLRLADCLQFSDKGQLLVKDETARRILGIPSRKRGEQTIKAMASLRDKLAHAQDIVTEDWSSIVALATNLHGVLAIGAFAETRRSAPKR